METTIRTREPRELLALIPFQLGFAPRESLVVVSVRGASSRVGLVARADLADVADQDAGPGLARTLVAHLVADGARRCVVVVYADTASHQPGSPAARAVAHLADAARPSLGSPDVWLVGPAGYRAFACEDAACCPPQGRPLSDLEATQVGAHMVLRGARVLDRREDLAAVVPAAEPARRAARRAAGRWAARMPAPGDPAGAHRWRREGLLLWRELAARSATGGAPDATEVGRLQAALGDVLVRDAVLLELVDGAHRVADRVVAGYGGPEVGEALRAIVDPVGGVAPEGPRVAAATAVLEQVVAHGARHTRAPASTLLAVLAWWQGDGARAGVLVERALAASPGYRLAELLDQTLAAGMPPGWLRARAG